MKTRRFVPLVLAAAIVLVATPLTPSISQAGEPHKCPPPDVSVEQTSRVSEVSELPTDDVTSCGLVGSKVKLPSGKLMTVPLPGHTVTLSAMTAAGYGETPEIIAHTSEAGVVAVMEKYADGGETLHGSRRLEAKLKHKDSDGPLASIGTGVPTAVTGTKCSYNQIHINPKSWTNVDYHWKLTVSPSWPLPGPEQVVIDNLTQPSGVWMHRGTTCNISYPMTKHNVYYAGTTTRDANVNSDGTCSFLPDHLNTVQFKNVTDPGKLAWACVYADANRIFDADIIFDTTDRNWALHANGSTPCSGNTYVLAGVAAHEFGHAYGMAHSGQKQETEQVMRPELGPCQMSDYSLGAGDLASYYAHYHY